jgi:transcriptional regulator with XRE-family HTH domain
MSQSDLAKAAKVDARQIRRYETGEQQPLFTVAAAIASALGIPLAELAGQPDGVLQLIRQGLQFIQLDQINGELRITGDDDAALLLWAAQWLDEHRDYMITGIRFEHPAQLDGEGDLTATVVIELTSPGTPSPEAARPRLGPWSHGVPPMPL